MDDTTDATPNDLRNNFAATSSQRWKETLKQGNKFWKATAIPDGEEEALPRYSEEV